MSDDSLTLPKCPICGMEAIARQADAKKQTTWWQCPRNHGFNPNAGLAWFLCQPDRQVRVQA
jgi:predicted RNA-binding Zn-ribbon protein involved in translation (DUF1610 family)